MYIINLFKEIVLWRRFAKVSLLAQEHLAEHGMRVDYLGRIYTVINMPSEIATHTEEVQTAWVFQQLKPFNEILLKIGLAGYAYPELRRIKTPGTSAFLVFLYPEFEDLKLHKILIHSAKWVFIYFVLRVAYNISTKYIDLSVIYDFIKQYI